MALRRSSRLQSEPRDLQRRQSHVSEPARWKPNRRVRKRAGPTNRGVQEKSRSKTGHIKTEESIPDGHPRSPRRELDTCSERHPVQHWASHGFWPPNYPTMSNRSSSPQKRPRRSPSYSQSSRSGDVPLAHSAAAEPHLASHGVFLDPVEGRKHVLPGSKDLCNRMLEANHTESGRFPPCIGYPIEQLDTVLGRLRSRNERRIVRDLTPLLVPSVENLALSGVMGLDHIAEDLDADWRPVQTMGGPVPRPDVTIGLSLSALTPVEREKLDNYKSWDRATSFTNHVLFPFLICEVKGSDQSVNKANRQAGHSAAMATNAIWQLYHSVEVELQNRAPDAARAERIAPETDDSPSHEGRQAGTGGGEEAISVRDLDAEVVVLSVAHDNNTVEVYGHFPITGDGDTRPSIYRHLITAEVLLGDAERRAERIRNFVLEAYLTFSNAHLERIRRALRVMAGPETASIPATEADVDADAAAPMRPPSQSASQMRENQLKQQVEMMETQTKEMQEAMKARDAQISQLMEIVKRLTPNSPT